MEYIKNQVEALNELAFSLACELCDNDIVCIFQKLDKSQLDQRSYGFWIWDIPNNREYYSDKFRQTLGYKGIHDFPNSPKSWMNAIEKESLAISLSNYENHILTQGKSQYRQLVVYNKKNGGKVRLICHGKVVSWLRGKPKIMIGVHLSETGTLITS